MWDLVAIHRLMRKRPREGSAPLKQSGGWRQLRVAGVWPPDAGRLPSRVLSSRPLRLCTPITARSAGGGHADGQTRPGPAGRSWLDVTEAPLGRDVPESGTGRGATLECEERGSGAPSRWTWAARSRGHGVCLAWTLTSGLRFHATMDFSLFLRDRRWGVGDGLFPHLTFPNSHIRGYTRKTA